MWSADPYEPLDVLKPVAEDLWVVDGPVIRFRWLGVGLPFPTRMTVVRLADGGLWLHSPTAWSEPLADALAALGPVRFLVAPNKIHYWWLADWQRRRPEAVVVAAPGVDENAAKRGARIDRELGADPVSEWAEDIDHTLVPGSFMTEAVFLHRPSRSLILTDLIENFEAERIHGPLFRLAARLGGVLHPHGGTPRDLRATFRTHRADVRNAAETMIAWQAARILIAHGRPPEGDATAILRRVFAWTGVTDVRRAP